MGRPGHSTPSGATAEKPRMAALYFVAMQHYNRQVIRAAAASGFVSLQKTQDLSDA
jgi:hypothetical protein